MKPHVTYQQLKTQPHGPADLQLAEQPPLASRKDLRCVLVMAALGAVLVAALLLHTLVLPSRGSVGSWEAVPRLENSCSDPCQAVLVESIPEGLRFNSTVSSPSTFEAWLRLLGEARHSVDIAGFYWTLRNEDTHTQEPSAGQGEEVLAELLKLPGRGVATRIAVNPPSSRLPSGDLQALEKSGVQIRKIDLPRLTAGVLHTKFWIVDQTHIYLGSANMDWRALTQVKELGVAVYNCSCLAQDLGKMFEVYWALGLPNASIPSPWPERFSTTYNKERPLELTLNGTEASVYLSSAPPPLCASGRTEDLQALLSVIDGASEFVAVAVMSYLPTMEFSHPKSFWPVIDDHLRRAAYERGVRVRLLVGCWRHSKAEMFPFLRSLDALRDNRTRSSVHVRLFVVPADAAQARIPFARVSHAKFMVTERAAYVGTSNWSGDYFARTAGAALVLGRGRGLRAQLQDVFERDWSSSHSRDLGRDDACGGR